jgi:hypothetical protein
VTDDEIKKLFAVAMAYDNRKPSTANMTAWWEQAERNKWTFDEAREAIHQHHTESSEYLMPVHITAIIRRKRQIPGRFMPELPAAPKADDVRVRGIVASLAAKLRWNRAPTQRQSGPALTVICPHCHASVGRPCSRLATRGPHRGEHMPLRQSHPSRVELAEGAS